MGSEEKSDSKMSSEKEEESEHFSFLSPSHLLTLISLVLLSHLTYQTFILNASLAHVSQSLNNTPRAECQILFFNRVPKVGSQTIMKMLKVLGSKNDFAHYTDNSDVKAAAGEKTILPRAGQKEYVDMFHMNFTEPSVYNKHISFINFKSFGAEYKRPIYVNFVREPTQRVVSWYYYIRTPWYLMELKESGEAYKDFQDNVHPLAGISPTWLKRSYEDCLLSGDRECRFIEGHDHIAHGEGGSHASQMMFFCGHDKHCAVINSEKALRQAVRNVEEHFAVVGVLEEMEKSLLVLEHYLPRFFKHAPLLYRKQKLVWSSVNKNSIRPKTPQLVKDLLRKNMTREVEFYEFCRQRLHKQYLALGL